MGSDLGLEIDLVSPAVGEGGAVTFFTLSVVWRRVDEVDPLFYCASDQSRRFGVGLFATCQVSAAETEDGCVYFGFAESPGLES